MAPAVPRTDRERRTEEQFGVRPVERATRTYLGGDGDAAIQSVLRGMTGAGFHTTPSRADHQCFAAFDGVRNDDRVTVYICEIENPVSPDLRWEITIVGPDASVNAEVRDAIEA